MHLGGALAVPGVGDFVARLACEGCDASEQIVRTICFDQRLRHKNMKTQETDPFLHIALVATGGANVLGMT
jgi:hypothetical protein